MSLYQWLIDEKAYTEDEAAETVLRYDAGMSIPDDVKIDIFEYTEEFINTFGR